MFFEAAGLIGSQKVFVILYGMGSSSSSIAFSPCYCHGWVPQVFAGELVVQPLAKLSIEWHH